jgi:DNA-directed RNA polymerase specialized sigma24 family protein
MELFLFPCVKGKAASLPVGDVSMSLSRHILAELPMLRRFARAATGHQDRGDACVEKTLAQVLSLPSIEDGGDRDLRTLLYKGLVSELRAVKPGDAHLTAVSQAALAANRHLMEISPHHRIAFLLKTLEGFSPYEIATILDCSFEEAERLVAAGSREIAEHLRTDVLIIEDEPFIALDLEELVTSLGHRVTGIARTHQEAIKLISRKPPGIVLSDIKLADGSSGLTAVNEILEHHNVPVIFITAFPERFLKGEKPEPAFLVTKPFLPETIRALISQALFFDQRAGTPKESAA